MRSIEHCRRPKGDYNSMRIKVRPGPSVGAPAAEEASPPPCLRLASLGVPRFARRSMKCITKHGQNLNGVRNLGFR